MYYSAVYIHSTYLTYLSVMLESYRRSGDHPLSQGIDALFSGYSSSSGTPKWHRRILIPRREVSCKLAQTFYALLTVHPCEIL